MKRMMTIVTAVLLLGTSPAMAGDTKAASTGTEQKSQDRQEKKAPGTMEKAGNSVKAGWHKFTKSVKQGRKKPECTPEQKSLTHCD